MATRKDNPTLEAHVSTMKPVAATHKGRTRPKATTEVPDAASPVPAAPTAPTVPHSVPAEESPAKQQ